MDCQNRTWVGLSPRSHHYTSAHVAHVLARLQAAWAEVVGPGGASDQKSDFGSSMYPSQVSLPQFYKHFCDKVVYPTV